MSASAVPSAVREPIRETLRIAGERIARDRFIEVRHPYDGTLAGTVPKATREDVKRALKIARGFRSPLTRHDRYQILMKAGAIIASKRAAIRRCRLLRSRGASANSSSSTPSSRVSRFSCNRVIGVPVARYTSKAR